MKHWRIFSMAAILLVTVTSAAGFALFWIGQDGRPSIPEAATFFESRYPQLKLVDIELTENEVVACSFKFNYVRRNTTQLGTINIQFVEDPRTGIWQPHLIPNL